MTRPQHLTSSTTNGHGTQAHNSASTVGSSFPGTNSEVISMGWVL